MTNLSLFVSRLRPSVEEETLKLHIKTISSTDKVTCEKLKVKYDNYVSYKIVLGDLQKNKIPSVFQSENWPKGIVVKRWYEKKTDDKNNG